MPLAVTTLVDVPSASVRITVTGGTVPYTITASPTGVEDYVVRANQGTIPGDPAGRIAVDGALPLNTGTVYTITDATGAQVSTAAVTVTSSLPILSDATDPSRFLALEVVDQVPNQWEARSVWWDVLDAEAPFVAIAPFRPRSGELVVRAADAVTRRALTNLLRPGTPIALRSLCAAAVDDVVMLPQSVRDELVVAESPAGARNVMIAYQAVSLDLGPYSTIPGRTYSDLLVDAATYSDLLIAFVDYAELLAGDSMIALGPELVTDPTLTNPPPAGVGFWSTFWSGPGVTWSGAGYARAVTSSATPESAALYSLGVNDLTVTPGARYRITGRVRCVDTTVASVEVLTNTAPGVAQYFQPGTAVQAFGLVEAATWVGFALDVTVPAGDDRMSVIFRGDNLTVTGGAAIEWDDLSVKVRL